ncbi:transglutaminase domain-containing protein [Ancylomarina longa]|uniref:Transglutaminase-like domain-containing protein n=1 Tax=Ancylomarina longa TaxID=2487017 RepID=A0A434AFT3_9BACT|nr:transglutaminase domain-containing protein [Ancylomarina longa]RUT73175.1 hypothetical protein DLK05_14460 [Ancylomarina longa]
MLKKLIFLCLLVAFCLLNWEASAQHAENFRRINFRAENAPDSVSNHLISLHQYLVRNTKNDTEKIRAFYIWIIHHITYEDRSELIFNPHILFYMGTQNCSSPVCVLSVKKAVCEGYSNLFQSLCQLSGFESYTIGGYVKQNNILYDRATHAWNVVKVNGKWCFFDPTWASAAIQQKHKNTDAINQLFMVSPEKFIEDHLPLIPLWQFMERPVPYSVFNAGKESIDEFLGQTTSRGFYHFTDSLRVFNRLAAAQQHLKTGEQIAKTNPSNKFNRAIEYYRFAHMTLNYQKTRANKSIDTLLEAKKYIQKSILIFQKQSDVASQLMKIKANEDLQKIQDCILSSSEKSNN